MILKYGNSYDHPLERHSIDYFVSKKLEGRGWRGDPLEAHLELELVGKWLMPTKDRTKEWEKFFGGVLFPKPLRILSSKVNGYKELRKISEADQTVLQEHIALLDKHFPIKERTGKEKGQYAYLIKCKKRSTPIILPEILENNKRLKYEP